MAHSSSVRRQRQGAGLAARHHVCSVSEGLVRVIAVAVVSACRENYGCYCYIAGSCVDAMFCYDVGVVVMSCYTRSGDNVMVCMLDVHRPLSRPLDVVQIASTYEYFKSCAPEVLRQASIGGMKYSHRLKFI